MNRRSFYADPVVCFVCKRAARGFGYAPPRGRDQPIAWVCADPTCNRVLKSAYHMPVCDLSTVEAYSLADAGIQAGAYLESIGKTDLGDLSESEWCRFLKVVLTSYESAMRDRLLAKSA